MLSRMTPCIVLAVLPFLGCAGLEGVNYSLLSTQQEMELGEQIAGEVRQEEKILDDAELQSYVRDIGARLAQHSPRKDIPYKFTVIDNPDVVNAFAIPGGHMYIYTGLMKLCESEAQLAGVMGHEIGHIAAHHHGERVTQQYGMAAISSVLLGDESGQTARLLSNIASTVVGMKFSREAEYEADVVGMDLVFKAGYKPEAMVAFYERMLSESGGGPDGLLRFLSSHPATEDRIARLRTLVQQYPLQARMNAPTYESRYQTKVLQRLR